MLKSSSVPSLAVTPPLAGRVSTHRPVSGVRDDTIAAIPWGSYSRGSKSLQPNNEITYKKVFTIAILPLKEDKKFTTKMFLTKTWL